MSRLNSGNSTCLIVLSPIGVAASLVNVSINLAREKGFRRLEIETLAENSGVRRVTEKTGFKLECVRKDGIHKDEDTMIRWRILC